MTDVLSLIGNLAVKIGTAGILSLDDVKLKATEDLNVEKVKTALDKVITKIKDKYNVEKIVIVVDELDRCNPRYVVHFLEELKHFYENENLCIVISTNLLQLANTVKKLYGENFNGNLYLQRFFDAIFTLNKCNYERYIQDELQYYITETHILHEVCKVAININKLSVREINKFLRRIKEIESLILKQESFYEIAQSARILFVPWGLALKYSNMDKFIVWRNGEMREEDFYKFISASEDFFKWITECFYGLKREEDMDYKKALYKLYKEVFIASECRLHSGTSKDIPWRKSILALIDF